MENSDAWWITNFSLWLFSFILPDLPEILSAGMILIILYWLGAFAVRVAILSALSKVGTAFFGIPRISSAIMGIIWLCIAFGILTKLFGSLIDLFFKNKHNFNLYFKD